MNPFVLPVSLRIFIHLAMTYIAFQFFLWLRPISEGVANSWAPIAIILFIWDFSRWSWQMITAFRALNDIERGLRHASQGMAMMVLTVVIFHWAYGSYAAVWTNLTARSWIDTAVIAVPILIGLARLTAGVMDVWWFPFRFMPVLLAAIKVLVAALLYLWGTQEFGLRRDQAGQYSLAIITIPAIWFAVTGTVRLIIVTGVLHAIGLVVAGTVAAMRRRLSREKVYGASKFADTEETRIRLRK